MHVTTRTNRVASPVAQACVSKAPPVMLRTNTQCSVRQHHLHVIAAQLRIEDQDSKELEEMAKHVTVSQRLHAKHPYLLRLRNKVKLSNQGGRPTGIEIKVRSRDADEAVKFQARISPYPVRMCSCMCFCVCSMCMRSIERKRPHKRCASDYQAEFNKLKAEDAWSLKFVQN